MGHHLWRRRNMIDSMAITKSVQSICMHWCNYLYEWSKRHGPLILLISNFVTYKRISKIQKNNHMEAVIIICTEGLLPFLNKNLCSSWQSSWYWQLSSHDIHDGRFQLFLHKDHGKLVNKSWSIPNRWRSIQNWHSLSASQPASSIVWSWWLSETTAG